VIRVAVIGPGRVGTALALALPRSTYQVTAVAGRGQPALDSFIARLPETTIKPLTKVAADADLVLVCVPDDALAQVVQAVADAGGVRAAHRWVHMSGGYGTEVLEPARLAGAAVAACHPAMTFPDPDHGLQRLPGAAWAVTADSEDDLDWARALVNDLGGCPVTVPSHVRTRYQAGLAMGSNATVATVTLARDLLLDAGISDPNAFLGPLATASAAGAAERGAAALTGPVRRGDAGMIRRHLDELRAVRPDAVEPYEALSRLMLRYARLAGLDDEAVAQVGAVLDDEAANRVATVLVRTVDEARRVLRPRRQAGERIGFVPTMGALHEGHLSLVSRAATECDVVVVSIFVNPLQFAPTEDFAAYPRDLAHDLELLSPLGVDLVFHPDPADFTPPGRRTTVTVSGLTAGLEAASRPTHFDGVTTIVAKLLNVVAPDRAYFGEKDFQQLAVVRAMVRDLDLPVEIVGCPTVRDSDGLALSSRNAYLSPEQRQHALALSQALRDVAAQWDGDAARARATLANRLEAAPGIRLDYAEVVDPETLEPLEGVGDGPAQAVVAAYVGMTRLIDNCRLEPAEGRGEVSRWPWA
jgi:pantoate--beta-alanine ligase